MTGFSKSTKCVNRRNPLRGSRSPSSARLFEVKTSEERFGMEFATEGWMLDTRFLAISKVRNRGNSGKLAKVLMSLSVKSIASWSCVIVQMD